MIVIDSSGRKLFNVRVDYMTLTPKMWFYDVLHGTELLFLQQRFRIGMAHYDIFHAGRYYAKVKKVFQWRKYQYEVRNDLAIFIQLR